MAEEEQNTSRGTVIGQKSTFGLGAYCISAPYWNTTPVVYYYFPRTAHPVTFHSLHKINDHSSSFPVQEKWLTWLPVSGFLPDLFSFHFFRRCSIALFFFSTTPTIVSGDAERRILLRSHFRLVKDGRWSGGPYSFTSNVSSCSPEVFVLFVLDLLGFFG